jgi:hypothetical protein
MKDKHKLYNYWLARQIPMYKPKEIYDKHFGKLSFDAEDSVYSAIVTWRNSISIMIVINVGNENLQQYIEMAWNVFSSVRNNEEELLKKGIEYAYVDADIDEFLCNEYTERTIQVFEDGDGQINYYLFGLGSFIVWFSRDVSFKESMAIPC